MKRVEEQINYNIQNLDVDLIHRVIKFLNIKWTDSKSGADKIPSKDDIISVASYCMRKAFQSEDKFFSIGGFESEVIQGVVEIKFILTKSNSLLKLLS